MNPFSHLSLGPLDYSLGYRLRMAQLGVFQAIYRKFGPRGLTLARYSTLVLIAENPGIRQSEIAEALGVVRPRMVPLINRLLADKLISREVDDSDRRARFIRLTKKGRTVLEHHTRKLRAAEAHYISNISKQDQSLLIRLLGTLSSQEENTAD